MTSYVTQNIGAGSVVYIFTDLLTQMPSTGVSVSPRSLVSVLIDGTVSGSVQIFVTFDGYTNTGAGATGDNLSTALWTLVQTVTITAPTGQKIDFLVAPTGIKLATATSGIAARIIT